MRTRWSAGGRALHVLAFVAALAALLIFVPAASAQLEDASFEGNLSYDTISGPGFTPYATVTVVVKDAPGGTVLYSGSALVGAVGWFEAVPGVDLVPGMCISVSEGLATRELTLAVLSIDGLSPAEDTVTGTAPPSATFWVDAGVGDETPGLEVTSDGNGDWTADFGAIGVDITPYTHVGANIGDADGDQTAFDLQLMELPAFEVHRDAERTLVYFQWWTAGETLALTIEDPTTPASPDFTTSIVAEEYPVGGDGFGRWFDYVVKPGDVVTVTDGITTKSHTVTAVAVISVDQAADVVRGTASPGTEVSLWNDAAGGFSTFAAGDGTWIVDLSAVLDIVPGTTGIAAQADEDGDSTNVGWQAPPLPSFDAHPGVGAAGIFAKFWPADSTLTVTVDDPLTAPSPDYATEFVAVEWTDVGYGGWFDVQHEIKAGDVVSVTDGTTTKSHIVIDLRVTSVDVAADRVSGTVPTPDSAVHLFFDVIDGAERNITADASGQWMADFSVAGGPDEPSVDIVPGIAGGAAQFDDDGNATVVAWQVPRPEGWQHNPATGHDYLFVEDGRPWADAEAYAVSLGGHLVTVSDAAENGWLIATFGTEYYIGMNDRAIEGTWVWASGEPVTFTGWLPDEPNDYHGGQDAARIWNKPPIGWDDVSDSGWDPFVVEREANDPPLAAGDAYTVVESGSLTVPAPGVLGNDSDPEGGPLTAALGDDVTHGTLSLAADGSFTYVPAAGFAGMDAFTYAAVDALGQRATATVTITVASLTMASWSFDEGEGTTAFDATGRGHNGTVVGSTWTTGVSGSALSFDGVNDVVTAPYHPDLWPTQSVTAEAWVKLDRLPAAGTGATVLLNGNGVASTWSYYLSPIEGGHVQWSLFTGDGIRRITSDTALVPGRWYHLAGTYDRSASRLYVDGELAAEATGITAALISRSYPLTIGAYYYGSALSQMLAGAIDEVAIHARSLSASEIAEHHAEFANDPPLAAGDAYTVVESGSLTVPAPGVLGNDSDPEGGPLTAALGDDVTHGTLSLAADGSFTYVPAAGFAGMDAFTYAAVDALGQRATATVTITVTPPPNNPPIAYAGGPYTAAEGGSFALEGRNSFDIDAASGDSIVSYAWDLDADGIFDDAVGSTAAWTYDDNGTYPVALRVTDTHGATGTATTTALITNVAPTATFEAPASVVAGQDIVLKLSAPSDPSFADTAAGFGYAFDRGDGSGLGAYGPTASVTFPTTASGVRTVAGRIRDKDGGTTIYSATVEVTPPNHPPIAYAGGPYAASEGGSVMLDGRGSSDPDQGSGDSIVSYAWDLDADGIFDDAVGSTAAWTYDDNGTYPVALRVTDTHGATGTATTTALITNVAPTATFEAPASVVAGQDIVLKLSAPSDPSAADTAAGFGYAFDCGDGSGLGAYGPTASVTFPTTASGVRTVAGRIRDKDGGTTAYTVTVEVGSATVASWPFDEGQGTTAIDATGRGHDGTVVGATWTTGVSGSALSFDGIGDVVTVPYHADFYPTNAVTVEAWVMLDELPAEGSSGTVLQNGDILARNGWNYYLDVTDDGRVRWSVDTSNMTRRIASDPVLVPGNWYHLAGTYNGFATRLYVNGALATEQTGINAGFGPDADWGQSLTIGAHSLWFEFEAMLGGTIDEVAVHVRALSDAEIAEHHAAFADEDADGIAGPVEDGAPNSGDGNADGVPDRDQGNVASLPNAVDGQYVTVESPAGTHLTEVEAIVPPEDPPDTIEMPYGLMSYAVEGVGTGAVVTVTHYLPLTPEIDSYWKYGPTTAYPVNHWYEFLFDGVTGAGITHEADRTVIVLHYIDGQRGDAVLTTDARVVDPGGPAIVLMDTTPPVITLIMPKEGATYLKGQAVSADWSVRDAHSGVATQSARCSAAL